jgi:tetratricopeptide (TPR) repeat protein
MKKYKFASRMRLCLCTVLAFAAALALCSPALEGKTSSTRDAERNPHMKEGIRLYKRGNFRESMTEFALALNSEFHNATLHYYMANSLVGMRQREAAIREFRIAYALAPKEEPGMLAHLALSYMGADNYDDNVSKKAETSSRDVKAKSEEKVDPAFDKALEQLKKQADDAMRDTRAGGREAEVYHTLDENIKRSRNEVVDALLRANPDDVHLTPEASGHLNRVKRLTEEKSRMLGATANKTGRVKDSADSLQSLLQDKNTKSTPRLVPRGTNLYIRNYTAPTSSSSAKTSGGNKADSSSQPKNQP